MKITKHQILGVVATLSALGVIGVFARSADASTVDVYRLYNKVSMEHLYTTSANEYNTLPVIAHDWIREGVNFKEYNTAQAGTTPVHRIYNPRSGEHIYTMDTNEVRVLTTQNGWRSEGVAFYTPGKSSHQIYRVFNPAAGVGAHFVTADYGEMLSLTQRGWMYEGVAWYGVIEYTGWVRNKGGKIIWQKGGFKSLDEAGRAAAQWGNEHPFEAWSYGAY